MRLRKNVITGKSLAVAMAFTGQRLMKTSALKACSEGHQLHVSGC
jgi:hypothetical protein